jgi:hypothetical protein
MIKQLKRDNTQLLMSKVCNFDSLDVNEISSWKTQHLFMKTSEYAYQIIINVQNNNKHKKSN